MKSMSFYMMLFLVVTIFTNCFGSQKSLGGYFMIMRKLFTFLFFLGLLPSFCKIALSLCVCV